VGEGTYYSLAVVRCPETYRHVAENLGDMLFLGKRSRLCEFGKQLVFEAEEEAEGWVASFYKRGRNAVRYELKVIEVTVNQEGDTEFCVHQTIFSMTG